VVAEVVAQLGRRHQRVHLVEHERVKVGSEQLRQQVGPWLLRAAPLILTVALLLARPLVELVPLQAAHGLVAHTQHAQQRLRRRHQHLGLLLQQLGTLQLGRVRSAQRVVSGLGRHAAEEERELRSRGGGAAEELLHLPGHLQCQLARRHQYEQLEGNLRLEA